MTSLIDDKEATMARLCELYVSKEQQASLKRVWERNNQSKSYLAFRRTVCVTFDNAVIIRWSGRWLRIEPNGHIQPPAARFVELTGQRLSATNLTPATPIRALALKLTYAQQYGAGDQLLEEILADYLKEISNE